MHYDGQYTQYIYIVCVCVIWSKNIGHHSYPCLFACAISNGSATFTSAVKHLTPVLYSLVFTATRETFIYNYTYYNRDFC